jgi:hypothetical protein
LQLSLSSNQIGAKALATALQSGRCPQDLQLDLRVKIGEDRAFRKAWELYYADQQREKFSKCMSIHQGHQQNSSPFSQLPQEILDEIYHYILPATPILAKMTEISAKAFLQHYVSTLFSGKSTQEKQLKKGLKIALSAKTFAERAKKIKVSVEHFLKQELVILEKGQFTKSSTVALLCKYHLIAKNRNNSQALGFIEEINEAVKEPDEILANN